MPLNVSFDRSRIATLLVLLAGTCTLEAAPERPNFVFILADDLGWSDLGCYGSSFYETPALDALAADSLRFTNAYAACQVCSPTRASILSGKYPARLHTTDYFGGRRKGLLVPAQYDQRLALEEVTIAEALKEAGYHTASMGKWHLGGPGHWPEHQGFDVNVAGHTMGMPATYFWPYRRKKPRPFDVPGLEGGQEGEQLTDRLTDEALKFIEAKRDEPFFLYLPYYAVHTPLEGKKELVEKYRRKAKSLPERSPRFIPEGRRRARQVQDHAVYAAMVETLDTNVGRILDKLESLELTDRTVVVFFSDNGGLSTSEGSPTSNLPLRAGKGWMYEGGIREPLIVRWPGVTKAGTTCDTPVISTDFYPTLLDMAGLPARPEQHVDGVSIAPLLRGETKLERDTLYWHYPHYGNQGGSPSGAIREGNLKLIERFESHDVELYDLEQDIGEQRNLVASRPEDVSRLRTKLHAWQRSVGAHFPHPNAEYRAPLPRALIIGDSISMGYTPHVVKLLADRVHVTRIDANGGPTQRGLARFDEWVGRGDWDVIHFNWGLHDLCYRLPGKKGTQSRDKLKGRLTSSIAEYERNLRELVEKLQASGARLVWATTTPVPEGEPGRFAGDAARYNAVATRVLKGRDIAVNDLYSAVLPELARLQKPGGDVHFTAEGSRFLAEHVADSILRALELGETE